MRFEGTVALVTGATGGIGAAVARRLAREGARVALHTHARVRAGEDLAAELPGGPHAVLQADLTDPTAVQGLVEAVILRFGRLDVLVNNAGIFEEHPPLSTTYRAWQDAWERTLALNLVAPANLCLLAAQHMAERGGGRIINVGSRGAFRGEPTAPAYGASKAGLHALTQSLAKALLPRDIVVTAVAPGFVDTPMVAEDLEGRSGEAIREQSPAGRVATPDEVAAVVAFLASGEAPFTAGAIVDVNGASYLRT